MLSKEDRKFVFNHAAAYVYNGNPERFDEAIAYAHWYMDNYGDVVSDIEDLPWHTNAWRQFIKESAAGGPKYKSDTEI